MTLTRGERASAAMCRVLDIATRVIRGLTILAIASVAAIAIAWVAWVARTPPVGTTIRFSLVSRAFGPRSEAGSACPWKLPGSRTAITRKLGPSKLSGRRSGLDPIPQSEPAESGHSSPSQGDFPHPRSWPQASKETRSAAGSQ